MQTHDLSKILRHFSLDNSIEADFEAITHGYINDTYLVSYDQRPTYILQRINHKVFTEYVTLQRNIDLALKALKSSTYSEVQFINTNENSTLLSIDGTIWRLMTFIKNSQTFNTTTSSKIALEAGKIIGTFHSLLEREAIEKYDDVISGFHHLPTRKDQFIEALDQASDSDKSKAQSEIQFAVDNLSKFDAFYAADLPIRICHNDTKLNNILFDMNDQALCLIDLDTIMKGHFHYDFGDAIRTIANSAVEDEKDLSKISFSDTQFEQVIRGLKQSGLHLSEEEIKYLPIAVPLMPFIHGLRALTDFLNKNRYYKVSYPEQNLDRSKSLFQFAHLALEKQTFMAECIRDILK